MWATFPPTFVTETSKTSSTNTEKSSSLILRIAMDRRLHSSNLKIQGKDRIQQFISDDNNGKFRIIDIHLNGIEHSLRNVSLYSSSVDDDSASKRCPCLTIEDLQKCESRVKDELMQMFWFLVQKIGSFVWGKL